jgi:hypothetical protein
MGFLAWIVVGLIAGWLAGQVMKGGGYGVLVDINPGYPWRNSGRLGIWRLGYLPGWRHDRLHHCCFCRRSDPGRNYAPDQAGLVQCCLE